jgi:hypothetical protein
MRRRPAPPERKRLRCGWRQTVVEVVVLLREAL